MAGKNCSNHPSFPRDCEDVTNPLHSSQDLLPCMKSTIGTLLTWIGGTAEASTTQCERGKL